MGPGPRDEGGAIFARGELDVLELAFADGPNGHYRGCCQNSDGGVVLVPLELVDARLLAGWELCDHFPRPKKKALKIQNSNTPKER